MNDTSHPKLSAVRTFTMAFIWLILNAMLVFIAYYLFSFMFESNNFYGKGSTGIFLMLGYGFYKVHKVFFKFVVHLVAALRLN